MISYTSEREIIDYRGLYRATKGCYLVMELVVCLVPVIVIEKKGDVTEYSMVYKEVIFKKGYEEEFDEE